MPVQAQKIFQRDVNGNRIHILNLKDVAEINLLISMVVCKIMYRTGKKTGENMSDIYSTLNPQQQEAVYHTEGPLLILAGRVRERQEYLPTALLT